jgi:molybdopterin molybdotransferase
MMGKEGWERPMLKVRVEGRVQNPDHRRFYARAIVREENGELIAALTGPQGSGILTSMALANALVIVPEYETHLEDGAEADAVMLGPVRRNPGL